MSWSTGAAYDVVIVGGGHNGLVAACYLARAGLRVLVLEKNDHVGGMAASGPFIKQAPRHVVSPGAYENAFLRGSGVVEELELERYGYRDCESAGWAWLGGDGDSICFQRDLESTARDFARFSRKDGIAYRKLMADAIPAARLQSRYAATHPSRPGWRDALALARGLGDRGLRGTLTSLLSSTAADAIAARFERDETRGALAHLAVVILGALTAEGSAIALLCPAMLHERGMGRPVGGMGGVISALDRCFRAHGGEVRLEATVARVASSGGVACGAQLADGRVFSATKAVMTAIPPQRIPGLVPDLDPGLAGRLRAAPANAAGVAALTVSLALSGRVALPLHQPRRTDLDLRKPLLFTGGFETVLAAFNGSGAGIVPVQMPWWAAIFTAIDPSQAPEGQDVIQLYSPVPVAPRAGWEAERDPAAERLLAQAGTAITDLAALELGRFVETPDDLSRRTGAENGCLYHVDHVPTRLGPLRPALGAGGYRASMPGLYVTGAGTHPNGGVSGLPGKLAATTLLRDLTPSQRRHRKHT